MEKTFSEAAEVCLSAGASDVFLADTQERKDGLWTARGAFLEAIKASADEIDECDVVVPRNQVASFMSFAHSLEEAYHLPIRGFGHAGDGNLHIYVLRNQLSEDAWMLGKNQVMKDLYDKAQALLGQVSGEHGIGYDKISYLSQIVGSENIRLMQGIRKVFDPKGILNPGKLFEENHN
jgi:glycolate oxidase